MFSCKLFLVRLDWWLWLRPKRCASCMAWEASPPTWSASQRASLASQVVLKTEIGRTGTGATCEAPAMGNKTDFKPISWQQHSILNCWTLLKVTIFHGVGVGLFKDSLLLSKQILRRKLGLCLSIEGGNYNETDLDILVLNLLKYVLTLTSTDTDKLQPSPQLNLNYLA